MAVLGDGGVGKTALAVQVRAHSFRRYRPCHPDVSLVHFKLLRRSVSFVLIITPSLNHILALVLLLPNRSMCLRPLIPPYPDIPSVVDL